MQIDPNLLQQRAQMISKYFQMKSNQESPNKESIQQQQSSGFELSPIVNNQLLVLTVQIDENRTGLINVYEGDEPEVLAIKFCKEYGVNVKIVPLLIQNIQTNIDNALKERQNQKNYVDQKQSEDKETQKEHDSITHSKIISQSYTSQKQSKTNKNQNQEITFSPKINKKSRKLAQNRSFDFDNTHSSVYDRLFQDAQNKKIRQQIIEQSKENEEQKKSRVLDHSNINYGLILYQRGLKKYEEKMQQQKKNNIQRQKAEQVKREQISNILQECTHQPQINEISKVIAKRPTERIGDYLNKVAQINQEKLEQARSAKALLEQDSCSFKPQINKISSYIIDEKKKQADISQPHYESLYQDYQLKQHKIQQRDQQILQEVCTFHPKIDGISQKIVQGTNFNERMQKYQLDRIQSKEKSMEREQQFLQESQLFRPRTGRPPENRSADPFQALYNHSQAQLQIRQQKLQDIADKQAQMSKPQTNIISQKLINSVTLSALSQIFDLLDSDQDGQIDAQRVEINSLERPALEVLGPLLLEMEEGHHVLSKHEFIEATLRLINTLSVKQKHDLIFQFKKPNRDQNNEFTFHPLINDRSQKLAANKRPYGTPQVYDMFIEEKQLFNQKISQIKKAKDEEERIKEMNKSSSYFSRSNQKYQ